ncbi:hypothetical protein LCGC14_1291820 [marine sediment metagenome]|uniref:LamG-like jellyroll fold domain-containing protein n=1 Tax=marine sediment metagenome TaxID=412755 RepID=A0A0F9N8M0_9ZZZZ
MRYLKTILIALIILTFATPVIAAELAQDLVLYLRMETEAGGVTPDSSGAGNTGAITGATAGEGLRGGGYLFDGADDFINAGSDASIDSTFDGGGTVAAWINPSSDGEGNIGRIVSKWTSNAGWLVGVASEAASKVKLELYYFFSGDDGHWRTTNTEIDINTWTHVAFTYNSDAVGNDPVFYVNGSVVSITEVVTPTGTRQSDAAQNLRIGNNSVDTDNTFDGSIDEVMVFNELRTKAQIQADMMGFLQGGM